MSKVGVVLCRCNSHIDSTIDFDTLSEKIAKNKNVHAVIKVNMACSPLGKEAIAELAAQEEVDRLVVAACSPLAKGAIFKVYAADFHMPKQHMEVVNLREQCAWVHDSESATKKAVILLKMGVARVAKSKDVGNWNLNCAHINEIKCDKCKRCVEECPNNAISLREKDGYPQVNPDLCQKCGICVGGCPLGVISLPEFRLEEISAMLKPVAKADSPAVVGMFCEFAYEEADVMGQVGEKYSPNIYIIKVPCTGAVNMIMVNDAIAEGLDGILVAGCNASQCQRRKGNELATCRIENCQQSLEEEFLEKERLTYISLGEGFVAPAGIAQERCTGCGQCLEVCPYGAIQVSPDGKYEVYSSACRGCGNCAGVCRPGAIELPNWSDEKILAALDSILAG